MHTEEVQGNTEKRLFQIKKHDGRMGPWRIVGGGAESKADQRIIVKNVSFTTCDHADHDEHTCPHYRIEAEEVIHYENGDFEARKAWLAYHDTYSISSESAALTLVPKMARWTAVAGTWDAACGFSVEDVNPGRGIRAATRRTLDVTVGYIERGDYRLDRVRQAHAAYVEYKELRDTESQAVAHEGQLERCEEVKAAWVEHQLVDADQLCVPVPLRIAKKYPATTGYILGTTIKSLDGVIAARLEMRDKKRSFELVSLEDLKRDPRQNHVFICPCGYSAGEKKMTGHLKLNRSKAVRGHKMGYN